MADLDAITKTLIAEALGEGPDGMRMVAETILNRSQQRGIEPERVVAQPYQYTGYSNPGPAAQKAFNDPAAISAAQAAWQLAQGPDDPTKGANHYYAQNVISQPSWARNMTNTVTHGGHTFYTDRPFTQQSIPRAAPSPSQPTPSMAALRQMSSPTNGNTALQTALNQYATRERNRVTPAIPPWAAMGMNQQAATPDLQTALNAYAAREAAKRSAPVQSGALSAAQRSAANRAALQMNQSYVGQDSKGRTIPYPGVDARLDAARRAALSMGSNMSYAGNQGTGKLGPRLPSAFGAFPQGGQIPGANGTYIFDKDQTRINPNRGLPNPFQVNQFAAPANVPLPRPRPNLGNLPGINPTNVAIPRPRPNTGMTVPQPMPANMRPNVAPVPFARPNFGMGGPGFAPVNSGSLMAGVPAQRAPLNIVVEGSRTIQPPAPVYAPSVVNQLRATGMSPAEAYAAANSRSGYTNPGTQDRTRDRDGGASGLTG